MGNHAVIEFFFFFFGHLQLSLVQVLVSNHYGLGLGRIGCEEFVIVEQKKKKEKKKRAG